VSVQQFPSIEHSLYDNANPVFFPYPATPSLKSDANTTLVLSFLSLLKIKKTRGVMRVQSGRYSAGRGPQPAATIVCGGPTSCSAAVGMETTAPSTPKSRRGLQRC
jgi:hypothetical protein